ncbi:hypothetical protein [Micromonospora sp. NBC_01813]|uniref:hypothetical protein n=1 Tax=Micromonospora sp. NBC_01813 TaxID=2975988 RepID=UPI002DDC5B02|nr:hypothetical protein [Micromonospora sp. NBC_01813]WSA12051.1 hypothetical protein OG958_15425 [Micromonospora sp. NBC_01813]
MPEEVSTPFYPRPSHTGDGNSDGGANPDAGADLGHLVPALSMRWDAASMPSFNTVPETPTGDSTASDDDTPVGDYRIQVQLGQMRDSLESMLTRTSTMVAQYELLAAHVRTAISGGVIYGQQDIDTVLVYESQAVMGGNGGRIVEQEQDSPIQDVARQFADSINPVQQRALLSLSNAVALIGQYIGTVNVAGRTYAQLDRVCEFPAPPAANEG